MRWTDIDDIVEALQDNYPEEDIVNLRFTDLHSWVVSLLEFEDDPSRSNEKLLERIQEEWIQYREEMEE